jgi:hypothetical protein
MRAMLSAATAYAAGGYDVLLDFSIPPGFLDTARKVAMFKDVHLDYIVLRPSKEICASRAASRAEGTITDYARYADLYDLFAEADANSICDDLGDPAAIAARVRDGVASGMYRIV